MSQIELSIFKNFPFECPIDLWNIQVLLLPIPGQSRTFEDRLVMSLTEDVDKECGFFCPLGVLSPLTLRLGKH